MLTFAFCPKTVFFHPRGISTLTTEAGHCMVQELCVALGDGLTAPAPASYV